MWAGLVAALVILWEAALERLPLVVSVIIANSYFVAFCTSGIHNYNLLHVYWKHTEITNLFQVSMNNLLIPIYLACSRVNDRT